MAPVCGVWSENGVTDRSSAATAPALAAAMAPSSRYWTVGPYPVNGTLKSTIFPRASAARASSSAQLPTTMTSASIPPGGVPMLPPSPSIGNVRRTGRTNAADSAPRTHRGTSTGSPRTLARPSRCISAMIQSRAFSRLVLPLRR